MTEQDALLIKPEQHIGRERIRIHNVEVQDDFSDEYLLEVQREVQYFAEMGFYGDSEINLLRERNGVDMDNPATQAVMEHLPGIREWFKTIPRAIALTNIYDPTGDELYGGTKIGEQTKRWFCNIADAIGIRSRSKVLQGITRDEHRLNPNLQQASLACGAAQPVLEVFAELFAQDPSCEMELTLADLDKLSIEMAAKKAEELGISDRVYIKPKNILHISEIDLNDGARRAEQGKTQFDIVEALGFLEYLKEEDQKEYQYNGVVDEKKTRAGAITFLKNAYDLVRPGGLLVVGNMLDTHPELALTLNVVQWPHIQPRSIEEMTAIIDAAGIGTDAELDIYCPSDGVYAIYAIRKPAESGS